MAFANETNRIETGIVDWVRAGIANLQHAFAAHRTFRTTMEELNQLSNRELQDLGISRSEIPNIARQAAFE